MKRLLPLLLALLSLPAMADTDFIVDHFYYRGHQNSGAPWITLSDGSVLPPCELLGTSLIEEVGKGYAKGPDTENKCVFGVDVEQTEVVIPVIVTNPDEVATTEYQGRYVVTLIGDGVFQEQPHLTKVTLPDLADAMKHHAFENATDLENVQISTGDGNLKNIGLDAFKNSGLKTLTLPNSIERIDAGAFTDAKNLDCLVFTSSTPVQVASGAFSGNDNLSAVMFLGATPVIADNNETLKNATCYVTNVTADMAGLNAVPIVSGVTTEYGKAPVPILARNDWNGEPIVATAVYVNADKNGNLPAGCYTNEPIRVTLSGPVTAQYETKASFFIEPATLTAKVGDLTYTYGQTPDLASVNIRFDGFQGSDTRQDVIDMSLIKYQVRDDAGNIVPKVNDLYPAGTYKIHAYSEEGHYTTCNGDDADYTYSKCSPQNYRVVFTNGTLNINKANNPLVTAEGNAWPQDDITLQVGETKHFVAAQCATEVTYTIADDDKVELDADALTLKGLAIGPTTLTATAAEDPNYVTPDPIEVKVTVVRKTSDLDFPQDPDKNEVEEHDCITIEGATGSLPVTYTVVTDCDDHNTETTNANGDQVITTCYATVTVKADGSLEVCGKSAGRIVIRACTEQTDEMEASCKDIVIDVVGQDAIDIPAEAITWPTDAIEGIVGDTKTFEEPIIDYTGLTDTQGKPWEGLSFTYTLTNDGVKAALDAQDRTIEMLHHTGDNPEVLTLKITDKGSNGETPKYKTKYLTRDVVVKKKPADYTPFNEDNGWPDDGTINVKVEETKDLPAVPGAVYTTNDNNTDLGSNPATVTVHAPGEVTVTATIHVDDDTEDAVKQLTIIATRNERTIAWDLDGDEFEVTVDELLTIAPAQLTGLDEEQTDAPADAYTITQEGVFVRFAESLPSLEALAVGEATLTLTLPQTDVYEAYTHSVTITVVKKDVDITNADGTEPRNPATYVGLVGTTIDLDALVAPEGYQITYEVPAEWADYLAITNYGGGIVKADLKKVTENGSPALAYAYISADAKTNESAKIELQVTIKRKPGTLEWDIDKTLTGQVGDLLDIATPTTPDTNEKLEIVVSDPTKATLTDAGKLELKAPGTVTLTVNKPATDTTEEVTRTVTITIDARKAIALPGASQAAQPWADDICYDLAGRRIATPNGLHIQGGKLRLRK